MRFAAPPVAPGTAALDIVRAKHLTAAALIQRNPPPHPCDPRDVAAHDAAVRAFEALAPQVATDAILAFHREHICASLASCPLGPKPQRGAR